MKITLANLATATQEDIFYQVQDHLLEQKERSVRENGTMCLYKNEKGLKCAAGCLISEEEYKESFEDNTWEDLVKAGLVPIDHMQLIRKLQLLHDKPIGDDCSNWPEGLEEIKNYFGIKERVTKNDN